MPPADPPISRQQEPHIDPAAAEPNMKAFVGAMSGTGSSCPGSAMDAGAPLASRVVSLAEFGSATQISLLRFLSAVPVDTDNDGRADAWGVDMDGDGKVDTLVRIPPAGHPPGGAFQETPHLLGAFALLEGRPPPVLPPGSSSGEATGDGNTDRVLEKLSTIERRLASVEQAVRASSASGAERSQRSSLEARLPKAADQDAKINSKLEEILQSTLDNAPLFNGATTRRTGRYLLGSTGTGWTCGPFTAWCVDWVSHLWWFLPVVDRGGRRRMLWSSTMVLARAYIATVLPLQVGFPELFGNLQPWNNLNHVIDGASLVNLVVKARTSFSVDGMLVQDPVVIATQYVRDQFVVDAIVAVPLSWITTALPSEWRLLLILLVMRPLVRLLRRNEWAEGFFRFHWLRIST